MLCGRLLIFNEIRLFEEALFVVRFGVGHGLLEVILVLTDIQVVLVASQFSFFAGDGNFCLCGEQVVGAFGFFKGDDSGQWTEEGQ